MFIIEYFKTKKISLSISSVFIKKPTKNLYILNKTVFL